MAADRNMITRWVDISVNVAWWLATAATVAASLWLISLIPAGPTQEAGQDWERAASRIEGRLGTAEIVLINRAGKVYQAGSLEGLPLVCDEGGNKSGFSGGHRDGLWVVGDKALTKRLKKALRGLKKRGTISFGKVHLHHGWNQAGGGR